MRPVSALPQTACFANRIPQNRALNNAAQEAGESQRPAQDTTGLSASAISGRAQVHFGATVRFSTGKTPEYLFSIDQLKPSHVKTVPGITEIHAASLARVISQKRMKNAMLIADDTAVLAGILREIPKHNPAVTAQDILCMSMGASGQSYHPTGDFIKNLVSFAKNRTDKSRPLVLALQLPRDKSLMDSSVKELAELSRNSPNFENLHIIFTGGTESFGSVNAKTQEVYNFKIERVANDEDAQLAIIQPEIDQIAADWNVTIPQPVVNELSRALKAAEPDNSKKGTDWILDHVEQLASFSNPSRTAHKKLTSADAAGYLQSRGVSAASGTAVKVTTNAGSQGFFSVEAPGSHHGNLSQVVGHDDAKAALKLVIKAAKYPNIYRKVHAGHPKAVNNSVLLYGPKGNGKTEMARALAGEINAGFISGTGNFANTLVGGGAIVIRDMEKEILSSPHETVVVFLDEIDAMGKRESGGSGSHTEDNKIVNQFLSFMDGFKNLPPNKKVIVVAATNNPGNLDDAVLDRFVHKINIRKLTPEQRRELLGKLLGTIPLAGDVKLDELAERAMEFNGRTIWQFAKRVRDEAIFNSLSEDQLAEIDQNPELADEMLTSIEPLNHQQLSTLLDKVIEEDNQITAYTKKVETGSDNDMRSPGWEPRIGYGAKIGTSA